MSSTLSAGMLPGDNHLSVIMSQSPASSQPDPVNPYTPPAVGGVAALAPPDEAARADRRGTVLSLSFLGLLFTQFLGALNDNMFRWLIVPIGKDLVDKGNAETVVTAGAILLTLPFILFAAPAGFLADRFAKRGVIIGCKVGELLLMLLGTVAILTGNVHLMFGVLFLIGIQAALFGPSKYGSIPEIVRPASVNAANGLIGMTTIAGIVIGTIAGYCLYAWTRPPVHDAPAAEGPWWIWAAAILGVSVVGLITSFAVRTSPAADPSRKVPWNLFGETYADLRLLLGTRPLMLAALGCTVFWSLGGLCQINTDRFATQDLGFTDGGQQYIGPLLGVLALGAGMGNVIAGMFSQRLALGIVAYGALGIAVSAAMLWTVPDAAGDPTSFGYLWSLGWLFLLGVSAGIYDVPLQAYLQYRSDEKTRGSILAASNFLTFVGTIVYALIFLGLSWLGVSSRTIFLIAGISMLPVAVASAYALPAVTTRVFATLLGRLMYRVKIEGLENLPADRSALIVSNHVSWADGMVFGLWLPRDIRMVAYAEYFDHWSLRWFGKIARIIPIRPGKRQVVESIREARDSLNHGELVGIFPEGGLTRDGKVHEFMPGFLSMIKGTDAPVVPVYLDGLWGSIFSYEGGYCFWKLPKKLRRTITVRIGKPIEHPQTVDEVRDAVLAMAPLEARG